MTHLHILGEPNVNSRGLLSILEKKCVHNVCQLKQCVMKISFEGDKNVPAFDEYRFSLFRVTASVRLCLPAVIWCNNRIDLHAQPAQEEGFVAVFFSDKIFNQGRELMINLDK